MSSANNFVIGLMVLVGFIGFVFGIKCYECSSYDNPECIDLQSNNTNLLQECPQHENYQMFCRKIIQKIIDQPNFIRITRTCGYLVQKTNSSYCQVIDNDFKLETSCQCFTDGCNGGQVVTSVMATLILLFIGLFIV